MRTQLFRTDPVTIPITTQVEVFKKNVDGAAPLTLYVENTDVAASLVVSDGGVTGGSPQSKITYKAVAAGAAGNSKRVQVLRDTANPNGLAVNVVVNDVTYTIGENITAARLVSFVIDQGNPGAVTAELTTPATGGYGQAGLLAALTNLAGGVDSTVGGAISTETSDQIDGPWSVVAGTPALAATQAADSVQHSVYTQPMKFFRLLFTGGAAATRVVATAIAEKKVN